MTHGVFCFFFGKIDLRSAYRSVKISFKSPLATGFKWNFGGQNLYLKDTRLPFGGKLSPGIFHRLTQAVKRMMERRGFNIVIVYLDDFLITAETKEVCALTLNCLVHLLRRLGFAIHWGKVIDPTNKIIFLGIELDSIAMSLRLPEEKLTSFRTHFCNCAVSQNETVFVYKSFNFTVLTLCLWEKIDLGLTYFDQNSFGACHKCRTNAF